ncbi:pyridoxal phosphate-dependent decarboxylase family protein [Flavobacterium aquatile]|uniref:Amino acid decarboxylase n=1 Tax=Flavobacterium aquatile LMG 4008 = ATCC 11947 TaxID=1453498 RepID=A0A095SQT0_9FLAO|nr:aminotransferase class V-fold PLP-dependent enzyme [Flavobacterium aquatile]KGD66942.1 amino acid decarboxylase [Flavobacterium aquatile LMG 4008 = ATCC 11947]OXA68036.1 amino acid decarboxylase [Flavobacterium aquatile LMG 4008 = ATCC 11947]GEC80064.1 L-2,4-diaminobutyrate decarboxylase [Flavobacterium aquatile]
MKIKKLFLLEESPKERKELVDKTLIFGEHFLNNLSHLNAYNDPSKSNLNTDRKFAINEKSSGIDEILSLLEEELLSPGLNTASGANMGYIPGGGIFSSALGDYIAAISNKYAGVFYASPGAVNMENELIRWTADLVGYSKGYGGNLTSGGSIANLIALLTAKKAKNINIRNIERTVIYCSHQSHHSIQRAINIIGLEDCIIRYIDIDSELRMNTEKLEKQIVEDLKIDLNPFLIVANAGSTDAGMIDPLCDIGKIATQYSLWFHIDAAYGGFYLLTKRGQKRLKGISLADSIIMDPHKSLFLPYGSGVVLVKNINNLIKANQYSANYMQDANEDSNSYSPSQLSPELSKHFRGLRMWLPLKLYGHNTFEHYLDEKLNLARYFYSNVKKIGFEVGPKPDLSIVTFRFLPKNGSADDLNRFIIKEIQNNGKVFISSTTINGNFTLRAAIVSFRTHKIEVDSLLNILSEILNKKDITTPLR